VVNAEVSAWTVTDHLDHLASADSGILEWLCRVANGVEASGEGGPNFIGRLVLLVGVIPRGRGQAPESLHPTARSSEAVLDAMNDVHSVAKDLEEKADGLSKSPARMRHFAFDNLNAYQWIRLGHIHHRHHRSIIEDILRASI